jgi:putative nucleotidyltransferase with HDIG domain
MQRPTVVRLSIFLATVVATWGVLSLGTAESEPELQVGQPAPQRYTAAKAESVVDSDATEVARQEARDSVEPIKETNDEIEASVKVSVDEVFEAVETAVAGDAPAASTQPLPELPTTTTTQPAEDSTTTTEPQQASLITGRVFLDVDGDNVYNPDAEGERVDLGLARVTVQVRSYDSFIEQVRTGPDGTWSIEIPGDAAVVTVGDSDAEIPDGWIISTDNLSQLVECAAVEQCVAQDLAFSPNLRPLADVETFLAANFDLSEQTIMYLAATASDDIVRAGVGEPLHLPRVKAAAQGRVLEEFGRKIELDQEQAVRTGLLSNPPLVFHLDESEPDVQGGEAAGEIVSTYIRANYLIDVDRTAVKQQEAADTIPDVKVTYIQEQEIVGAGVLLTQLHIDAIRATAPPAAVEQASMGLLAVVAVLVALLGLYLSRFRPEFWARPRMVALLGILILLAGASVRATVLLHEGTSWYVLPAVVFGFVTAILFDQRIAILMALAVGVLTAVGTLDVGITVYAALAALAPIPFVSSVSTRGAFRNAVVFSAMSAAVIAAATSWFFHVGPADQTALVVGESAAWAFGVSAVASLLGLAALQFFEAAFDITTTLSLLDLTDRNHEALQLLQEEAFGTFNHSLMVGTLADAAARSVGADPLLARAMAYYHDLGKTEDPLMFIENQFGIPNPHDTMDPKDSAEVIRNHVRAGVALARRFKIPTDVTQGIVSHHGDGVMRYFYEKARERHGEEVDIDDFRHIGHKPRTAETAILMLADSLEAACRAVFQTEEPTPDAIEKVVDRVMDEKIEDGQMAESPLTLGELTQIRSAFLESLVGHYHQRIAYPNFPGS